MNNDETVPTTARLNFAQKTEADSQQVAVEQELAQAEEAQQEAMAAEAEEQPQATVEAAPEAPEAEAEAQTETSEALPVDAPEAPVELPAETITEEDAVEETREALETEPEEEDLVPVISPNVPQADEKSVEELAAERARLDAQIKAKQDAQKASVIDQIKSVMSTYSVSIEDLVEAFGGLKGRRTGVLAKAKYKDPVSGKTWSGRGKEPAWIKGQDRSKFAI